MRMPRSRFATICVVATTATVAARFVQADEVKHPNVVVVITDDQGYGDVAFTGNPAIQTPTIDKLRKQGTLLNNFHVDPTCAPTRSALMTGRWRLVNGEELYDLQADAKQTTDLAAPFRQPRSASAEQRNYVSETAEGGRLPDLSRRQVASQFEAAV